MEYWDSSILLILNSHTRGKLMFSDAELWELAQASYEDDAPIELVRFIRDLRSRRRDFPELVDSIADCDRRACEWLRGLLANEQQESPIRGR
jgi:hypothetical protein